MLIKPPLAANSLNSKILVCVAVITITATELQPTRWRDCLGDQSTNFSVNTSHLFDLVSKAIRAKSNLMIPKSSKFSLPQLTTLQEPTSVKLIHFGILINSNPIKLSDSWLDTTLNLYFIQIHVQCGRLDINPQSEETHLFSNQSLFKKNTLLAG